MSGITSIARRRAAQTASVVVIAVGAVFVYRGLFTSAPQAQVEETVPVMVRSPAPLERVAYISVSGEVEAESSVDVAFEVAGTVAEVMVDEGDAVGVGDTLARIDDADYGLQAELADARSTEAEDAFRRADQMHQDGGIAPADYVRAETAVRMARAQAALARRQIEHATLESPLAGVVARRGIDPGEPAAPGRPVFTILAMNPVEIRVGVPEAEVGRVRPGARATITLPSMAGRAFQGRVRTTGVAADPVSRTYSVKIATPNPDRVLRPGMVAEARIEGNDTIRTLTVPGEAVLRDLQGATVVFLYRPEERRAYSKRVEVGSIYGDEVEISSGLMADDLVVIAGQHRIRDGTLVEADVREGKQAAGQASPTGR